MIHKLSIVSWLLLHKHIAVAFIEDLGVGVEHEALIVSVGVAWDGKTPATIAHKHEKRGIREAYCLLWDVLFTSLRLQTWFRSRFLRAPFPLILGLRTDSLRCQVHFRWSAHRLSSGVGFLRPSWVTQMIRVVIQWSRISTLIIWLLPCVFIRVNSRVIIVPSFHSLFGFVAFFGYPTRREAVISRCDARWTIAYRFFPLVHKLRATSWRALFLSAAHIAVLFHTFSPLWPRLSTHSVSLIEDARGGKCVAEFTWQIMRSFFLPSICGVAAAPSAALPLHIEARTWFQVAVAQGVLWGSATAAFLEEVVRVVVDQVDLWGLLWLIFYFRLSW
jgi:hypothetical protein